MKQKLTIWECVCCQKDKQKVVILHGSTNKEAKENIPVI